MKNRIAKQIGFTVVFILVFSSTHLFAQSEDKDVWKAPVEADQLINPLKGNADAVKAGKKLYKQQCAICHGDTGKGDGVGGMSLNPKPTNFRSERVQKESDGALFWKITNGNAPMASYKEILSEEQRWQLVNYIRTFSKK